MSDAVPFDAAALAVVRRAYARQMTAGAGLGPGSALEDAFAAVPRERFLGPPPWRVFAASGVHGVLAGADPVLLYQDVNVALDPGRGVNNGSPSLHAAWLHAAGPRPGDRVVHIGAGTGYYSALLGRLVGDSGRVLAVEVDAALAARARDALAPYGNVTVVHGDGALWPQDAADVVYVSAHVSRPADAWLAALAPGGRLVFPLGVPSPRPDPSGGRYALHGAGLRVERRPDGFAVRWLGPACFVCAEGALADRPEDARALRAAFEAGGVEFVRSLRWRQPALPGRCWFVGSDWSLGYDEPA
ncbi:protein-L-isoaspartate O-methyltransferase family protein [Azospirillum sp. ST 5-10]|uniref:protein-L-isoaspartate O-methyltransferase family protein n=1 Tax=unclassified Azospirillum TaxID=2630922 RepID=UPI003F4A0812